MVKLKLQYFGPLMRGVDSLEKTLMLGKKDWRQEKGITEDEMVGWCHGLNGLSLSKLWEIVKDREAWLSGFHGVAKSGTRLSDWSELKDLIHREGAFLYVGWEKGILVIFVVWPTPCFLVLRGFLFLSYSLMVTEFTVWCSLNLFLFDWRIYSLTVRSRAAYWQQSGSALFSVIVIGQ